MSHEEVVELVERVQPGLLTEAYVMMRRNGRRVLRVKVDHPAGGFTHYAVTLTCEETIRWVEWVIARNRRAWEAQRSSAECKAARKAQQKAHRKTNPEASRRKRDQILAAVYYRLVEERKREERDRHAG
jgi:hypothetical protein